MALTIEQSRLRLIAVAFARIGTPYDTTIFNLLAREWRASSSVRDKYPVLVLACNLDSPLTVYRGLFQSAILYQLLNFLVSRQPPSVAPVPGCHVVLRAADVCDIQYES